MRLRLSAIFHFRATRLNLNDADADREVGEIVPAHPVPATANGGPKVSRWFRFVRSLLAMVLLFFGASSPLFAADQPQQLPTLTTCRTAHHLTVAEANRHYPVHLRAVVTYYEVESDKSDPTLFVLDESGSVYVALYAAPDVPLVPGDLVDVTGVTSGGQFAPIVAQGRIQKIGFAGLPASAPRAQIGELQSGEKDGQWIEVEAVVHSVHIHPADGEVVLNLSMRGGLILAAAPIRPGVDYSNLVDAKILLRGNAAPLFNHQQQVTGGVINFPEMAGIRVVRPANPKPFSLPVSPVADLLRYTPDPGIGHRVHLHGRATLFWPGRMLCLRDEGGSICSQITQNDAVRPGDLVDVIGFTNLGEFSPNLVDATYQLSGSSMGGQNAPVKPLSVTTQQALSDQSDSKLVTMEGRVIGEDAGSADPTIILAAEDTIFYVVLPKDPNAKLNYPEYGSRVRVTGICSIQSGGTADPTREGFPVAKSFRILMRVPSDLVILQKPSWWNAVHTLRVLAFALVLVLFALGRVALLSHRVHQQTAVIKAQLLETAALKDAAESATVAAQFHASHDELTGTLNRRSIFAALQKEFDLAAGSGNIIGVIMLDLDHFKRVNDTYGHLAGDEILRETVRRLKVAVRSSDLVGRYGGEEFMILLPRCEKSQLEACAERMRSAISASPMMFGEQEICMTASVGATAITPLSTAMMDALAAADSALYQAKNGGRDRVVLKDIVTGGFQDAIRQVHPAAVWEGAA